MGTSLDGQPKPAADPRPMTTFMSGLSGTGGRGVAGKPVPAPPVRTLLPQASMKASRSGLIVSAWVVHMPCESLS